MQRSFCLLYISAWHLVAPIPIENGVKGNPEIECGNDYITFNVYTEAPFQGQVFVKGKYVDASCRSDDGGSEVAAISLTFNTCNIRRVRTLNPRGVFASTTVTVTFHPKFITKVDRTYTVECFYMEADKTVSSDMNVSMLTTLFQTQIVQMRDCKYEILSDGPDGIALRYARIGQAVYHKWTCNAGIPNMFCIAVHSCYVDDGANDRVELLDNTGCSIDKYLLGNLEYMTDMVAGRQTHVFKYADRQMLYFQCQITISIKEPNQECPRPVCPDEPLQRHRRKTDISGRPDIESVLTMDVSMTLDALDIDDDEIKIDNYPHIMLDEQFDVGNSNGIDASQRYCLSWISMCVVLLIGVASAVTVTAACAQFHDHH